MSWVKLELRVVFRKVQLEIKVYQEIQHWEESFGPILVYGDVGCQG